MKSIYYSYIAALVIACSLALSIAANAHTKKNSETLIIKTNIYCDHCIECPTCGIMLDKELRFTKGVKLATHDPLAMTITVKYNPAKTNPKELREAISKLGYDADDVKADTSAYDKLDGCCKKEV